MQKPMLKCTLSLLQNFSSDATPPEIGYQIQQIVRDLVDTQDPYRVTNEMYDVFGLYHFKLATGCQDTSKLSGLNIAYDQYQSNSAFTTITDYYRGW
jgi:uncharacterized protein with ATP-grasp and redox domains